MQAELEDWAENGFALRLALAPEELDGLLTGVAALRRDHDQHFHISRKSGAEVKLGDIEISVMASGGVHNMRQMSLALAPGAEVPDLPVVRRPKERGLVRLALAAIAGVAGMLWILGGAGAAYVTFATNDYRPVLVRGVWEVAIGLVALHASSAIARGWKGRGVAFVGTAIGLAVLSELLRRLAR